jgi:hypothetical protein
MARAGMKIDNTACQELQDWNARDVPLALDWRGSKRSRRERRQLEEA